jgi:hypothetical protein
MTDLLILAVGIVVVVAGAEIFFDGLLGVSARLKTAPFVVTAPISGFELENLAAGTSELAEQPKPLASATSDTSVGFRSPRSTLPT